MHTSLEAKNLIKIRESWPDLLNYRLCLPRQKKSGIKKSGFFLFANFNFLFCFCKVTAHSGNCYKCVVIILVQKKICGKVQALDAAPNSSSSSNSNSSSSSCQSNLLLSLSFMQMSLNIIHGRKTPSLLSRRISPRPETHPVSPV